MSSTNPGPVVTTQNESQSAVGNLSGEWIVLLTPGLTTSIPANSSSEVTLTLNGVIPFDFIEVNKLNHIAGLSVGNSRVTANNTVAIQMVNSTAAPILLLVTDQYLVSVERPMTQYVSNGLPSALPL